MRIDVHGHIGELPGRPAPTGEDLAEYVKAVGVERLLVSNLDAAGNGGPDCEEADANHALLERCRGVAHLVPLYWCRVGRSDSHPYALAGALALEPFAGAVFAPGTSGISPDDRIMEPYLTALERAGRPAFFLTSREPPGRPQPVYVAARRHPGIPFVMCNAATDTHWHEALEVMRRSREQHGAQLYLATGQASPDDVHATVAAVGAEHIVFGSDALRFGADHAPRIQRFLSELAAKLSADAFGRVVSGNARRILRMPLPAPAPRPAAAPVGG
ncbi:MAG: amidohydrolase [Phycisphaerae bacterium]|nr:amidohydrolase family protein [Phycisphaerae bacterium]MCZ2401080.1 amidohydrolase [Phycisphaerae bacterium]NUQ50830.1 amidohydrolase family protein [Phycisphaerae bacterium]